MKPAATVDRSFSFRRAFLALSSFLLVTIVCILASMNEIQIQNLVDIGRSSFIFMKGESRPRPTFRLLIGIMTKPDSYRRRDLLRLVYGIQSPSKAQVDVKFVFCTLTKEDQKVLIALEIMRYNDIIILNCTENMNDGKTFTYFSSLPEIFNRTDGHDRPYDYVMKADDDVYLRLDRLVDRLMTLPREDMYYGFVIPCRELSPIGRYMSGMGYTLSWDLVEWIRSSDVARNHMAGSEDRLVGDWLQKGDRGKNRYNANPAMYNFPADSDPCSHEFVPGGLKAPKRWCRVPDLGAEFADHGSLDAVKGLINDALVRGGVPSLASYSAVIIDLYSEGKIEDADRLFDEMCERGFRPSVLMYEAKIAALCRDRRSGDAAKVVEEEMMEKNCVPTVRTYNAVMGGLCKEGMSMQAVGYLERMGRQVGCVADQTTYEILVDGLCCEGRFIEAGRIMERMVDRKFWPCKSSFNRLISGLCMMGRRYEAVLWLEEMVSQGKTPEVFVWNSLVAAFCSDADCVELLPQMILEED